MLVVVLSLFATAIVVLCVPLMIPRRSARVLQIPALHTLAYVRAQKRRIAFQHYGVFYIGLMLIALLPLMVMVFTIHNSIVPAFHTVYYPDIAVGKPSPKTKQSVQNDVKKLAKSAQTARSASASLVRVAQLDPDNYNSPAQASEWMYSTCSAASITEVINAWENARHTGKHYTIGYVLGKEYAVGAISSDLGLLDPTGIDRTVAQFGYQVTWLQHPSIDQLVSVASKTPVIIDFPPDRWSGGHILVATGGDKDTVFLADSSRLNMQAMDRETFAGYWEGFAAVVTPV